MAKESDVGEIVVGLPKNMDGSEGPRAELCRAFAEQLREATAAIRTPKECTGCAYKEVCGVCAALCYPETGRFDGQPEYICRKTKETVACTARTLAEREK